MRTSAAVVWGSLAVSGVLLLSVAGIAPGQWRGVESAAAVANPCEPPVHVVACENSKPGTPRAVWDISGVGDRTVQGFATDISVNAGEAISFKIDTGAPAVRIEIYRTGYYSGDGARLIGRIEADDVAAVRQPECGRNTETGLIDCGNWSTSATWQVPDAAVSGVYIARLVRTDTDGASHIPFIVRNDGRRAQILFQTADTSWQAYNYYGGESLYTGGVPRMRAFEISYNRPFETREIADGRDFYFSSEYAMVQFLEANGYDVTYVSGLDVHLQPGLASAHDMFMSVGHDEYWSGPQRHHVEDALARGTNLGFFSGNEMYWRIRWEESLIAPDGRLRTIVCFKETWATSKSDPAPDWTGTWRDRRFDVVGAGEPENAITGSMYRSNSGQYAIEVPGRFAKLRIWRDTAVAALQPDEIAVLAPNTLGYEFNSDVDNGFRPPGLIRLSETVKNVDRYMSDFGNSLRPGRLTHSLVMYRAGSGALVFGTGTIQWSWGFGFHHDGVNTAADRTMLQATVNVLADMGLQPATLAEGLVPAVASSDSAPPRASISAPDAGAVVTGPSVTVRGGAADEGGVVAAVEVSTDGGFTWHPADGTTEWAYTFNPAGMGLRSIVARAIDDSGNIGPASTGAIITAACPCTIFDDSIPDARAIESTTPVTVGTAFSSAVAARVTGMRFYRGAGNEGPHVGRLWTGDGAELATVSFPMTGEAGWQTATFDRPVDLTPGRLYVVGYRAPSGAYAADPAYFTAGPRPSFPLIAHGSVLGAGDAEVFPTLPVQDVNVYVDPIIELSHTGGASAVGPSAQRSVVRLFEGWTPQEAAVADEAPSQVGVRLRSTVDGRVTALRFYRGPDNEGPHRGFVWSASGELLGEAAFTEGGSDGWQRATLDEPVPLAAGDEVIVSYLAPRGRWAVSPADLLYPRIVGPLVALEGRYAEAAAPAVPTLTLPGANYGVDVEFVASDRAPILPARSRPLLSAIAPEAWVRSPAREIGTVLTATRGMRIVGIRAYLPRTDVRPVVATVWSADGSRLASTVISPTEAPGWRTVVLAAPIPVAAGSTITVSYSSPEGPVARDRSAAGAPVGVTVDAAVVGPVGAQPRQSVPGRHLVDVLVVR